MSREFKDEPLLMKILILIYIIGMLLIIVNKLQILSSWN